MRVFTGVLLSLFIGMGAALAQTPATAPTPSTAPAAQPAAPAKMTADQKRAVSKSCSDQATAKGLHGKERKKFRAACKKNGGTAPAQ
jgi:conjugal transfer/entry exclusion protein